MFLEIVMGLIKFILTHDTRVSLKKIGKMADKIMEMSPTYEAMTDDELKNQTNVLKERLANGKLLIKFYPKHSLPYAKQVTAYLICAITAFNLWVACAYTKGV